MRLFLAVDLPQEIKQALTDQIDNLKKEYPQFEWIPQENYHVTVYFFGDMKNVSSIHKRLEEIVFDKEAFYLYSFRLNLFLSHRIVVYMNFRREKTLETIAEKISYSFSNRDRDQKYIPHLSLARYKIPSKQQYFVLKKRLSKFPMDISFKVKKLVLFESINSGKFPLYKKLKTVPLL